MRVPHPRFLRVGLGFLFAAPNMIAQWLLFKYVNGEITLLSKPFKTKAQPEKARINYPERQRKTIAVGVIRVKSWLRAPVLSIRQP